MARLKLTNNTIQQGTTGTFSVVPNAGSAFINAPVITTDAASAALGVTLAAGLNDASGDPTVVVTVPASVPVATQITLSGTDVTAAGTITGTPLTVAVVAPIQAEPTSFTFVQTA